MEWVETTGTSVADAISAALDELGVDEQDAEIVVVDEPKSSLFGLRKTDARIRARVRPAVARPKRAQRGRRSRSDRSDRKVMTDAPSKPSSPSVPAATNGEVASSGDGRSSNGNRQRRPKSGNRESTNRESASKPRNGEEPTMSVDQQAEVVRAFVSGIVERFGYAAETAVRIEEDQIYIEVTGSELGLLIGPRGATLDALQELARTVIQRRSEEHAPRVNVDVAGFRAKRAEALSAFARGVASEVLSSGIAEALEPMSSADRKIVHDTINAIDGVVTTSEGADPRRYVVVRPATAEELADA
jgi:spoIIIJ-associated protein